MRKEAMALFMVTILASAPILAAENKSETSAAPKASVSGSKAILAPEKDDVPAILSMENLPPVPPPPSFDPVVPLAPPAGGSPVLPAEGNRSGTSVPNSIDKAAPLSE